MPIATSYEDYSKPVIFNANNPITLLRGGLTVVTNPDGTTTEGTSYYWEGLNYPEKFFPKWLVKPNGNVTIFNWVYTPYTDKGKAAGMAGYFMVSTWTIEFTKDEWFVYRQLESDDWIKKADDSLLVAVYYSLLNWKCVGRITPVLEPSPISPQSLKGNYNVGEQYWLEYFERNLRERIWKLRPDLREFTLINGTKQPGIKDPKSVETIPRCTSTAGTIVMSVAGAITAFAGLPAWFSIAMELPKTITQFTQAIKAGKLQQSAMDAFAGATGNALSNVPEETTVPLETLPENKSVAIPLAIAIGIALLLL